MAHDEQSLRSQRAAVDLVRAVARRCRLLLLDAVFPLTCPGCGDPIPTGLGSPWCEGCGKKIAGAVGAEYCTLCGRTTGPYERRGGRCGPCRDRTRSRLTAMVRVGPHKGVLRQMVLDHKFHQAPLDRTIGTLLAAAVRGASWRGDVDAIVPIPAHWRRRLERGHHPVRALSWTVGKDVGLPVVEVLKRTKYRPPQVGLSRVQRMENVRGTFGLVRGARVEGATLCLVDDVTTTGATLQEAARVLRRAGAANVYAAAVSKSESISTM
jgi:competence protein ComFC